jgi:hypothetical protein
MGACGGETSAKFGIMVQIRDAQTGAQAWYDAVMITSDGTYADTIRGPLGAPPSEQANVMWLGTAENRPGTYTVTITHPAYQTWRREGVRVGKGDGTSPFDGSDVPETVTLVAELQPFPQK